ncbi:class I SAM-dependent methyltransferase [Pseudomonas sp. 13B_2.1_Bac1]|jgi:SAM-dependent methyltransferase|uniref:class I SAM-dependent methyltransferase n=1 Tax=unclassified Pseudomonas TaxID=196821 RepID=UPI0019118D48|nr:MULTISPECIES: class I SAM-dependent methyltransferase [unclassified Pseudomonas]MBK5477079.1 class I SAM-dependent methyltransferase [Pseudomonas sp. TH21]MCU1782028.1 class I SAM-dependent methyltransferase [Pseudomonas sp. 13B_2.1_Bac1]
MDMPSAQQAITSNKDAWDQSAGLHRTTDTWNALLSRVGAADFSCLDPTITGLLHDIGVAGKDVVQLCCNNGRESLSLFGLGARSVVGVDQSRAFLQQAHELAAVSPHSPEFIESDIHQLPHHLHGRFDIALVTIGVLGWMPDVALFMRHVADTLKPGGTLVMYETHPFLEVFDPRAQNPLLPAHSYFQREPFVLQESIVYEGQGEVAGPTSYWYVHTLGDVVSAAIDAQLQISHLQEYGHSNREELYDQYEHQPAQLPLCFTLAATKRAP